MTITSSSRSLHNVDMDDLIAGKKDWSNLQLVIRMTFKHLIESFLYQQEEIVRIKHGLQEKEEQDSKQHSSMKTINVMLDSHIEALRAELGPKLRLLETNVKTICNKIQEIEETKTIEQQHSSSIITQETVLRFTKRLEIFQAELLRLSERLEAKVDGKEVEAALKLRVSKPSLQKRLLELHKEMESRQNVMEVLVKRVENLEGKYGKQREHLHDVKHAHQELLKELASLQQTVRSSSSTHHLEKHFRSFEEDIIRELDARDTLLRREVSEQLRKVRRDVEDHHNTLSITRQQHDAYQAAVQQQQQSATTPVLASGAASVLLHHSFAARTAAESRISHTTLASREQLDCLRKEKEALRSKIHQGLETLAQSRSCNLTSDRINIDS